MDEVSRSTDSGFSHNVPRDSEASVSRRSAVLLLFEDDLGDFGGCIGGGPSSEPLLGGLEG